MKNSDISHTLSRIFILGALFLATAVAPFLTTAHPSTTVNIVNNSSREVRNVYLSHVDSDDWSGNQLDNTTIAAGQSFTLSNVACDSQQVKIVAEDQEGCFLSTVVSCGESSTWTITNDTERNCGGS